MMKEDIWKISMEQSAIDLNCTVDDFANSGNTVVISKLKEGRKKCYKKPLFCDFVYYGNGLVASVDERIKDYIEGFIGRHSGFRCFDMPQLNVLNREFEKYGKCVCFIAEYFLPDLNKQVFTNDNIEVKVLSECEVASLYGDARFHMALGYNQAEDKKDVLAVVGYIEGKIAGVAGASNDSDTMWQIGVDVLPEYRELGVASKITKVLTDEIIKYGKVPFYCTAWSNIASKANAAKCGYKTAWVEMTAIDIEDAMKMIGEKYS
ncbi:GNAT family N-acetyltransferase [Clostridium sp. 19966]|uniref:GNAT family N-acetyltransferase n=1 Tax=Clostridium sp. 19966 TaxID=2768166 RepID=UPI0028E00907|nr:GNAT family N-acetyltransferase [Clostridium sp. 19966]MDT8717663.1 GNAT family N-acetyltransferase [Clostridium sp. 19966]